MEGCEPAIAYLEQHRIAHVLECCLTAVLSQGHGAESLVDALARRLEAEAEGGGAHAQDSVVRAIPPSQLATVRSHISTAGLETVVGEAVSDLLAQMPASPMPALAALLRRAAAARGGAEDAAAATRRWGELAAQGWQKAAAISLAADGKGAGGHGDDELLLARVTAQVAALGEIEGALYRLELCACERRMASLCAGLGLASARLTAVPSHYYSLSYEERVELLGAPSTFHLCKTIVLVSTASDPSLIQISISIFVSRSRSMYICVCMYVYTHTHT